MPKTLEVITTFIEPALSKNKKEQQNGNRKDELLKDAAIAMSSGKLQRASELFHQLAIICFEQEKFDEGMDFIVRSEDTKAGVLPEPFDDGSSANKRGYKDHLARLQVNAILLFEQAEYNKARNVLKQMIAIAEQIGNPVLETNYKQNLRKIEDASKAAGKKRK